jgi:hypothetical protein
MTTVACSRGNAQLSAPIRGRGEIGSAPTRRPRHDRVEHTTPPQIVWGELVYANLRRELFNYVPDEFLGNPFTPDLPRATHATEEATVLDSSSVHPLIQKTSHPFGNGHGPNVTSLPAQINDCPMTFALLEMINGQIGEFVPP